LPTSRYISRGAVTFNIAVEGIRVLTSRFSSKLR